MLNVKCKICRRAGEKLFLKGERCFSPKCALIKKPYPPGPAKKRRSRGFSEYGKQLKEKQKLKNWYGIRERQFKKYVKEALKERKKGENAELIFIKKIEKRADNVIFKAGIAPSRVMARQLVSHGHFLVNDKKINIPSYLVKKGDAIRISPLKLNKKVFQNIKNNLKKSNPPAWIQLNKETGETKIIGEPTIQDAALPADISIALEFYSR